MADRGTGGIRSCDDRCGCPSPCPRGITCRCRPGESMSGDHQRCSCGQHCSCNPCTCSSTFVAVVGKAYCKCGDTCACITCAS